VKVANSWNSTASYIILLDVVGSVRLGLQGVDHIVYCTKFVEIEIGKVNYLALNINHLLNENINISMRKQNLIIIFTCA
jgi:hypothetical protein